MKAHFVISRPTAAYQRLVAALPARPSSNTSFCHLFRVCIIYGHSHQMTMMIPGPGIIHVICLVSSTSIGHLYHVCEVVYGQSHQNSWMMRGLVSSTSFGHLNHVDKVLCGHSNQNTWMIPSLVWSTSLGHLAIVPCLRSTLWSFTPNDVDDTGPGIIHVIWSFIPCTKYFMDIHTKSMTLHRALDVGALCGHAPPPGKGLFSFAFQLNVSALSETWGAFRGCLRGM